MGPTRTGKTAPGMRWWRPYKSPGLRGGILAALESGAIDTVSLLPICAPDMWFHADGTIVPIPRVLRTRHDKHLHIALQINIFDEYSVDSSYNSALFTSDISRSPHTFLQAMDCNTPANILRFIFKFGPLKWFVQDGAPQWLDIQEFGLLIERFTLVTRLWQVRDDVEAVRIAFDNIHRFKEQKPYWGTSALGGDRTMSHLPWVDDQNPTSFKFWLRRLDDKSALAEARRFVVKEVNAHTANAGLEWLIPAGLNEIVPRISGSLWSHIWVLFARDTLSGSKEPRICPHCNKLFYPSRKDRFYCSSEVQKQARTNEWWNQHKNEQLEIRKKQRQLRS